MLITIRCSHGGIKNLIKQPTRLLKNITTFISEKLVGIAADDKVTIIGDPIGREALIQELKYEMIPYTPEELVEIANKELAWCNAEKIKVAREMGYGDDWRKALEAVKQDYVAPGKQPEMITRLGSRSDRLCREERPCHRSADREGNLANGNDVAGTPTCGTVLSRRRNHLGLISDRWHDARAKNDEHARQQSAFCTRRYSSRTHSRTSSARLYVQSL